MKVTNSTKALIALFAVFFSALTFQSCNNVTPLTQEQMEGYWVLKTLNGDDARSQFAGALPTLQFNFENNTISGTGGCNRYTGEFTYKEGIFSAPVLASTRMLCTENNNEGQFLLELSNEKNILSIEDGLLTISHDGRVVMQFERGATPTASLNQFNAESMGGVWILRMIDGVDATTKFPTESAKIPTINFDFNENRVSGNSGCNNYNAAFTIDENGKLIITNPVSTMMACPDMEGEAQFIQAIIDTSIVTVPDANTLQFAKGDFISLIFVRSSADSE